MPGIPEMLSKNVAVVHANIELNNPAGIMKGLYHAVSSLVLVRDGLRWRIASLHNTLVTAHSIHSAATS